MFEKNDRMFEDIRTMIAAMASRTANGGNSPTIDTGENSRANGYQLPTKRSKVEFPRFNGEDLRGWLFRSEQFFDVDETPSEAKVRLAALHLDGKALQWHQVYMRARLTRELPGWEEYIKALHDRFGSVTFEDPMSELMNLRQVSSVKDYLDKFDELLNNVDLSEAYAVSCFLAGLKNEIAVQVRMFKPKSLQDAVSLAKLQEQAFILAAKRNVGSLKHNSTFQKNTPLLPTPPQSYNSSFKNNLPPSTTTKPTGKRLTPQELEEKRAKGLCFLCDEKYSREHICAKKRQLYILDMNEDLDDIMVEHLPVDNDMVDTHNTPDEFPHSNFHISMNAMSGIHDFRTMRVTGSFKGKNIHILIDTGSTHNFIDVEAAKRLGCKLEATQCFPVSVADEDPFCYNLSAKSSSEPLQELQAILDDYQDLFAEPTTLPPPRTQDHAINLKEGTISVRPYSEGSCESMVSIKSDLMERIRLSWTTDKKLQLLIQTLTQTPNATNKFTWRGGVLTRKEKLVVGDDASLRKDILFLNHASSLGSHSGVYATYQRCKQSLYWRGLKADVHNFIKECDTCQKCKGETVATPGLLQPLPILDNIWQDISMDFIDGLPLSSGKDSIFVVVDRLSKYAHFLALRHPYSAIFVAQIFMDSIFRLHGMPKSIVSDKGSIFISKVWQELFKLQKVKLLTSTSYHPQTDGQTEVVNRCLESYLRCMCSDRPKEWVQWLPLAEYWYNTTYHSATKFTPFEIVYGYKPPVQQPYIPFDSSLDLVDRSLQHREATLRLLKNHLLQAQSRMKKNTDKERSERVIKRIGKVAYQLQLPPHCRIHPTFHVSQLKKKVGSAVTSPDLPVMLTSQGHIVLQPERILDRRIVPKHNRPVTQVLIKWFNTPSEDSTWEDLFTLWTVFCWACMEKHVVAAQGRKVACRVWGAIAKL
ncbi:hypothetical protein BUALT_Bualt06G0066500 [Buddleja alternifolia]|uniref:Integrase catalytic domain-containing protein n=1 Tax=Buddleja alternifolia TaxID=168488 RepID=A0AAV6XKL0_9LAMI|nr:hypothetical protein BUALT_Bualt06G0066500 [Buddleja alternifolia]